MARIVLISPYLKGGQNAAKLAQRTRYFATRPGVELLADEHSTLPATKKQCEFINRLVKSFPTSKELIEYEDYLANPTQGNASAFIQQTWEDYVEALDQKENFIDYISHRPGVQKDGEHGLWDANGKVQNLSQVVREVAEHTGNVWTPVVALRRQDAERLGYDNAKNWRALINASVCEIAAAYKIQPDHLRWYAAFHQKPNQMLPNTASAACEGFADVPEDAACYESVMYLAEHGITKGTEANTFSPAQPVTVRQWAVMLCRAYGLETSGETWAELGRIATEQACQKSWLNMTTFSATDTRMCRGALYESTLAAAGVPVYDSVLYEGGTNLSAYDNYLRVGCELQLCPADATASEIATRGEAAQLLHAILTQSFTVEAPSAPVTLENPTGVHANDFLLELRRVPEPLLAAFNEAGWTYRIDFDFMADLSDRLDMSCIGATSYGKKTIYVSDAKATIHEFGHFLDEALGFPAEHEQLYLAEAQGSVLRDYAKTNSREYFADCFVYWITYSGNEKRMEFFRNAVPQTYAYMEKLATNNWVC